MHKKALVFVVLLLVGIIGLSGCTFFNVPDITPQLGSVKIQIDVPSQFLTGSQQFVSHVLQLNEVTVTVKKGTEVFSQTKPVAELIDVYFSDLSAGTWTVEVLVKDIDGYIVYTGSGTGDILANSTTTVPVNLLLEDSNVDISISFDAALGVAAGIVTLTNPGDGSVQELPLTISGSTGTVSFANLKSTTWQMVAVLKNAADLEVARIQSPVDLLPGRTMTAAFIPDPATGDLIVNIGWELPPTPPVSCGAMLVGPNVSVSWEMSQSPNIAGYMLYRATSATGAKEAMSLELIHAYQFTDYNIVEGQTYWYWVQAYNTSGLCSDLTPAEPITIGDRSRILAIWYNEDNSADLCTMELDGSQIIRLTIAEGDETEASWSNEGMHILYQSYVPGNSEIYVKDLITNADINLTNTPSLMEWFPSYSPDGSKIIFNREENGYSDIFIMNTDGTGLTNLTNTPDRYEGWATISPDGTRVVYSGSDTQGWRAYTMNIDGSSQQQLPINLGVRGTVWSPDSTRIVVEGAVLDEFGSWTDTDEVWVINADGTNAIKLLAYRSDPCKPAWSPDGSKIVLGCDDDWDYQWDLFMVNPDGTGLTKLPENSSRVEAPTFSVDGSKIYFGGIDVDDSVDICAIRADGTGYVDLTPTLSGIDLRYPKRTWF